MTTKADFTDEEWTRLKRAPFVAGMAISLADPGGPIEAFKETAATLQDRARRRQGRQPRRAGDGDRTRRRSRRASEHKNPLSGFKPTKGATAGVEILDELRAVNELVTAKASPEDAAAVREWLLAAATAAANAAKEGGFMGFHAQRVSEGEQQMLDRLADALDVHG